MVTGGIDHVVFWTLSGRSLSWKRGLWGSHSKPQVLLSAAIVDGTLVTGTQSGQLLAWYGRECIRSVASAHDGPVLSLVATPKGGLLSGGKDGQVKLWDNDLVLVKAYPLQGPSSPVVVRSLAVDAHQSRIAVGLKSNEVYELVADTGAAVRVLQGLPRTLAAAINPANATQYAVVSAGDVVSVLDSSTHAVLRTTFVTAAGGALACSPNGSHLAVALGTKATAKEVRARCITI